MSQAKVEAICTLSPQQLGMLVETLSRPSSGIHIEQEVYAAVGDLDLVAFRRAWEFLVARHSILRTAFVWKDQKHPLQVVLPAVPLPFHQEDWRTLPKAEQERKLDAYLDEDRRRGFELTRAPLMRLTLFQTGERSHQFVLTQHHLLTDRWCRSIVEREFLVAYRAFSRNEEVSLPPSRPYRDYIAWLKAQDLRRAEAFWRAALEGFRRPTPLGRPVTVSHESEPGEEYGRRAGSLGNVETAALKSLARQHRLTLNSLVQGVWALLLSRYSGGDDVLFGTTVSGRPADLAGVESMLGLFINTLPFRVTVWSNGPMHAFLQEVQARHLEVREYEFCSAGQIHAWSEVPPTSALFESVLVYQNYPNVLGRGHDTGTPVAFHLVRSIGAMTSFPLTILVMPEHELRLHLVHNRRRLDDGDAARILGHFLGVLEAVARDPSIDCSRLLDLVPPSEIPRFRCLQESDAPASEREFTPAQTPTEAMLAQVWSEVLGVERVGVHDNFFHLGGYSLAALRLFEQIKQRTGKELPLATLFQAPTVVQLAGILDREGWRPPWSSLVPIQPHGSRPPFFCVHAHGGNVVGFYDLARHLGADQPFYGLQAEGLDGRQPDYHGIEAIAARYLEQIRQVQPSGPYYLGGHCFGGLVAFEMALQLRARGEAVAFLAIIDVEAPTERRGPAVLNALAWHLENLGALDARGKLRYVSRRARSKLRRIVARVFRRARGERLPPALQEVERRHNLAAQAYHPQVYPGAVILFRTSLDRAAYAPDYGWGKWAAGGVEVHPVPGDVLTVLTEPHVRLLARELGEALQRAQAAFESVGVLTVEPSPAGR